MKNNLNLKQINKVAGIFYSKFYKLGTSPFSDSSFHQGLKSAWVLSPQVTAKLNVY